MSDDHKTQKFVRFVVKQLPEEGIDVSLSSRDESGNLYVILNFSKDQPGAEAEKFTLVTPNDQEMPSERKERILNYLKDMAKQFGFALTVYAVIKKYFEEP